MTCLTVPLIAEDAHGLKGFIDTFTTGYHTNMGIESVLLLSGSSPNNYTSMLTAAGERKNKSFRCSLRLPNAMPMFLIT